MLKKILSLALAVCLMLALSACTTTDNNSGGNPTSGNPTSNNPTQSGNSNTPTSKEPIKPSSSENSGTTSGGSTESAPSGNSGGGADTYFNMLGGDTYHMKAKMSGDGMEIVMETYLKNGMVVSITEGEGVSSRVIVRDDKMYVIMDEAKTITVIDAPASSSSGGDMGGTVNTEGMHPSGSGTAEFDGKNLPYEEYSDDIGVTKAQFFMDGGKLAGIRSISESYTADMVILELDENVPDSVFDIPSDYEIMGG